MSTTQWIDDFYYRVLGDLDLERLRILQLAVQENDLVEQDPDAALAVLAEGRALAERLDERWWVLYFDHWRAQRLLYKKRDYNAAREVVLPAVVEARKPFYQTLPQRICLHEDLIRIHLGMDPEGQAEQIEQALAYMEQEITPDLNCRFCHQAIITEFLTQRGRLEEAEQAGLRYLEIAASSEHHVADAQSKLALIAFLKGEWEALLAWAQLGEQSADASENQGWLIEALAWQAAALRHAGAEADAEGRYRLAARRAAQLSEVPGHPYFTALCAYHELGEEWEAALRLREQELATLVGRGRVIDEVRCRVARCRLLARLGASALDKALAETRTLAQQLRNPQPILETLVQIEERRE